MHCSQHYFSIGLTEDLQVPPHHSVFLEQLVVAQLIQEIPEMP
jgi:hypothetical protein